MSDYRPVAHSNNHECFERLVMAHIKDTFEINVDPHQYAYRKNWFASDAISSVTHSAIVPQTQVNKLLLLGLKPSLCYFVNEQATDC